MPSSSDNHAVYELPPPWAVAALFVVVPAMGFAVGYLAEHFSICRINRLLRRYAVRGGTGFSRGIGCGWDSLLVPLQSVLICCAVAILSLNVFVLRLHCWIKPTSAASVVDSILVLLYGSESNRDTAIVVCTVFLCKLLFLSIGLSVGAAFQPVGLTGGIACGKTTVSSLLANDSRFVIIDIDKISHDVMDSTKVKELGSNSAYPHVVKAFGKEILQQSTSASETAPQVDRQKLGDVIFQDKDKRRILNKLTHPRIIRIMLKRIVWCHLAIHPARVVVVDIPLLFEAGKWMQYLFGYIVVVATKPDTQLHRLMKRNPELTKDQCQHRIDSQYPVESKVDKADAVLWNDGDRTVLETSLDNIKCDIIHSYQNWGRTTFGGVVLWTWLQAVMLLSMEYLSRSKPSA